MAEKKGFIEEFKTFVLRGNVMDMAVGVIIGGAFGAIITSLTEDIISPILGIFGGANFDELVLDLGGAQLAYGKFITAVINFLIMAFVIFCMVKAINGMMEKAKKPEEEAAPEAPTTKVCPFCCSEINIEATRCPNCTSELPKMKPESQA
ncbi:MAG: large conductance mechanosensitive channel protein MscL [Clostridium sp.]|nr:large conductance mechanosensitive channel protein MscL [Clostridium sp.]